MRVKPDGREGLRAVRIVVESGAERVVRYTLFMGPAVKPPARVKSAPEDEADLRASLEEAEKKVGRVARRIRLTPRFLERLRACGVQRKT